MHAVPGYMEKQTPSLLALIEQTQMVCESGSRSFRKAGPQGEKRTGTLRGHLTLVEDVSGVSSVQADGERGDKDVEPRKWRRDGYRVKGQRRCQGG